MEKFNFKTADKASLKAKYDEIAKKTGDDQFFTKKELKYLPSILRDDEQVLGFSSGLMDTNTWLIVLTDNRVLFLDKGMFYGLKQSSIPLNKINSVMGETGIIFGKIIISDGGQSHIITLVPKKTVQNFTNMVEEEINRINTTSAEATQVASTEIDKVSIIRNLHSLLDEGILSQEEFDAEKSKVLAS